MVDVRKGAVRDDDGEIVRLTYGPGATITRLNKGLRRRANRKVYGFAIDPVSGYWAKNEEEDSDEPKDPTASPRQVIVPSVQDRKNALLVQPGDSNLSQGSIATVQHALLRGIESVFQLEEGEVLAEPMPTRDRRNGFLFYEATEGGAGVLTRLVAESERLAEVAREALAILHFEAKDDGTFPQEARDLVDVPGTACVAACYRCLMSYYNQPDHERLDRRDEHAREMLLRLARSVTSGISAAEASKAAASRDTSAPDGVSSEWVDRSRELGIPAWDPAPLSVGELRLPLVWRSHYVVALLDELPAEAVGRLEDKGFAVIRFGSDAGSWNDSFARLAAALGRAS